MFRFAVPSTEENEGYLEPEMPPQPLSHIDISEEIGLVRPACPVLLIT
jgi:hypothetical protein